MKKLFIILSVIVCVFVIYACSNPTSSKSEPPAPKPTNYIDTMAVAAKKADFYVRLAFDLADGYLSDQSVVRKKYGNDSIYVKSLSFGQAASSGTIFTSDISAPLFKYWHLDDHDIPKVVLFPGIDNPGYKDNAARRTIAVAQFTGANLPSYQFDIQFRNTDTTDEKGDKPAFSIGFTIPGHVTMKGASMNITTPVDFYVQDSSSNFHLFHVTVNSLAGSIKVAGEAYKPKPADEFSMNGGTIVITGTDTSANPHRQYTITLEYANDKVENKTGNFTGTDGSGYTFSANYTISKDSAYYIRPDVPGNTHYVYWDYPL